MLIKKIAKQANSHSRENSDKKFSLKMEANEIWSKMKQVKCCSAVEFLITTMKRNHLGELDERSIETICGLATVTGCRFFFQTLSAE